MRFYEILLLGICRGLLFDLFFRIGARQKTMGSQMLSNLPQFESEVAHRERVAKKCESPCRTAQNEMRKS